MENQISLTVAIPTYNRHKKLSEVLEALKAQIDNSCVQILIIDNASSPPVKEVINDIGFSDNNIRIFQNMVNIGLGPNLIRAIEFTDTEWIWLLGDDDIPLPDSLSIIMKKIEKVKDKTVLIKFNSTAGAEIDSEFYLQGTKSVAELIKDPLMYSNFLFMSSSVFNQKRIIKYIREMYRFAGSLAPQIAGTFAALANNDNIWFVKEHIIKHGIPSTVNDHWDYHLLRSGFLSLSDMEYAEDFIYKVMPPVNSLYTGKNIIKECILLPYRSLDYTPLYWRRYCFKMASIYKGLKMIFILSCGIIIPFIYRIKRLRLYLIRRVGKTAKGTIDRS